LGASEVPGQEESPLRSLDPDWSQECRADLPFGTGLPRGSFSPNSFNCANVGPNNVVLTVTDVHGNSATCNATVTVQDIIPPSLVCPGDITQASDPGVCGAVVNFIAPVGTDNCPGVVTTQIAGLPRVFGPREFC
jgi:hypothetical protein